MSSAAPPNENPFWALSPTSLTYLADVAGNVTLLASAPAGNVPLAIGEVNGPPGCPDHPGRRSESLAEIELRTRSG